ncbi:MAG TPA: septum formation initiator family protein [Candidatus Andersenbacteria bacterium]|nr:septum formation initiator family protein [Candidatus Andersenbacteria bacterium]
MAFLRPNIVLLVTSIIVILIIFSLAQEVNRRLQVQSQIHELQSQVDSMQKHLIELQQLNEYFKTPDYQERIAREQLNYRAPGEKVVLIPETGTSSQQETTQTQQDTAPISIPLKWWYLFFVTPKNS